MILFAQARASKYILKLINLEWDKYIMQLSSLEQYLQKLNLNLMKKQ